MKFCKDCKFLERGIPLMCNHTLAVIYISPVTGIKQYYSATNMRENIKCGPNAKLFQPKPTFAQRIEYLLGRGK